MDSLTITIVGGLVVVVLGLIIEYGYFQRRRRTSEDPVPPKALDSPTISPAINTQSQTASIQDSDNGTSWPEAINKAIQDFSILHKGKTIELRHTRTDEWTAWLLVHVRTNSSELVSYSLTINKSGKIIKMDQTGRY